MGIVVIGPKLGETKVMKEDGSGFTNEFLKKTFVKKAFGREAQSLIGQENEEIGETRQSLREAEKQPQEAEKLSSEREKAAQKVQNLTTKLEQTRARIAALNEELGSNLESETEQRRLQQIEKKSKK